MQQPIQSFTTKETMKELKQTKKELLDGKFPNTTALDGAADMFVVARVSSVKLWKHVVEG